MWDSGLQTRCARDGPPSGVRFGDSYQRRSGAVLSERSPARVVVAYERVVAVLEAAPAGCRPVGTQSACANLPPRSTVGEAGIPPAGEAVARTQRRCETAAGANTAQAFVRTTSRWTAGALERSISGRIRKPHPSALPFERSIDANSGCGIKRLAAWSSRRPHHSGGSARIGGRVPKHLKASRRRPASNMQPARVRVLSAAFARQARPAWLRLSSASCRQAHPSIRRPGRDGCSDRDGGTRTRVQQRR